MARCHASCWRRCLLSALTVAASRAPAWRLRKCGWPLKCTRSKRDDMPKTPLFRVVPLRAGHHSEAAPGSEHDRWAHYNTRRRVKDAGCYPREYIVLSTYFPIALTAELNVTVEHGVTGRTATIEIESCRRLAPRRRVEGEGYPELATYFSPGCRRVQVKLTA